jgi:exodeoxyribonuclease V gamma subunit
LNQLGDDARGKLAPLLRVIEPPPVVASKDDSRVRLSISALRHYLECPLQGAARHALGMSEEDDDEETDADEEPITRSALDASIVLRETLWKSRGGDSNRANLAAIYDEVCRMRMLSGSAAVGPFAARHRSGDLQRLENAIGQLSAPEIPDLARWQRIAVGGVDEFTEVQRSIDPIILEVNFCRTDGRRVTSIELRGRVGPVSPKMDRSYKLVGRDTVKVADFLEGALGAIVLAAAGEKMPPKFIAMAIGGEHQKDGDDTRTIRLPTQTEARDYLKQLAVDLLSSANDHFLPIEAVEAIVRDRNKAGAATERAIDKVRGNDRLSCRSDYGPVRKDKARQFRAPLEEIEAGLIERRYGPLLAIFEGPQST